MEGELRQRLAECHRALEAECARFGLQAGSADPHAVATRWREFDGLLREHMAVEEELVMSAYQEVAPIEVCALRAEHAWIRELLDEISVDVGQLEVHADRIHRLVEQLHTHAVRESSAMYPWADQNLPVELRRHVLARLSTHA